MLIFGLAVFFRTLSEGEFHCPNCGGDRRYRHRAARRWFTLFFLPVIPLNQLGEIVECGTCRSRYDLKVLRTPTAQQMAAALPAAMRAAAVAVLQVADPADETARGRAIEAVRGYGATDYGESALTADLAVPLEELDPMVVQAGTQLTVEAREWFLAQAVRIALAGGAISDPERQMLYRIAGQLGMTPAHALGVIAATERARP
jgi:zinc-ribbon family